MLFSDLDRVKMDVLMITLDRKEDALKMLHNVTEVKIKICFYICFLVTYGFIPTWTIVCVLTLPFIFLSHSMIPLVNLTTVFINEILLSTCVLSTIFSFVLLPTIYENHTIFSFIMQLNLLIVLICLLLCNGVSYLMFQSIIKYNEILGVLMMSPVLPEIRYKDSIHSESAAVA